MSLAQFPPHYGRQYRHPGDDTPPYPVSEYIPIAHQQPPYNCLCTAAYLRCRPHPLLTIQLQPKNSIYFHQNFHRRGLSLPVQHWSCHTAAEVPLNDLAGGRGIDRKRHAAIRQPVHAQRVIPQQGTGQQVLVQRLGDALILHGLSLRPARPPRAGCLLCGRSWRARTIWPPRWGGRWYQSGSLHRSTGGGHRAQCS